MKVTVKVEGLSELADALEELPKATGTNVQKRALLKASEPIFEMARRLAPVLSGALKRSIEPGTKLSRRQKMLLHKQSKVEVYVGAAALPHAHLQEFGTVHHPAHPFLRPAWDANKRRAFDMIKKELADEIEKARARLARKTARLAAAK